MVGHFEAVGHVGGEAHVEDGGLDASVFHHIDHATDEVARLPRKSRAGFEDDAQVGIARAERAEQTDEMVRVVVGARDEMAAAKVEPLGLLKPRRKVGLNVHEGTLEGVAVVLAMVVDVEALDAFRQTLGQLTCRHTKTAARRTGIVEQGLYLAIARIDAKAEADGMPAFGHTYIIICTHTRQEPFVLREAVERDMAAPAQDVVERGVFVGWAVGVGGATKLFEGESRLVGRGGRGVGYVLAKDGEGAPQGKSLKSEDELHARFCGYLTDEAEVAPQLVFVEDVVGCGRHERMVKRFELQS